MKRLIASTAAKAAAIVLFLLLLGCAVAFGVSLLAIGFLMDFVKKHSFKPFGWYRIALGALVLVYFLAIK